MGFLINNKDIKLSNSCARTYTHTEIHKKIISLLLVAFMLLYFMPLGVFNSKVNAQNANSKQIEIVDISVKKKNETIMVENPRISNGDISSNIRFNEVGDCVLFELTLKNNETEKYKIKSITDNNTNENIEIIYTYSEDYISINDVAKFTIKMTYKKSVMNQKQISLNDLTMKIGLEKEDGSSEKLILNPNTGDNIICYVILFIIMGLGLYLIINKKRMKVNKAGKILLILCIISIPFISLAKEDYEISIRFTSINVIGKFEKYNVIINSEDGSNPIIREIEYGQPIGKLPKASKEGYIFVRWEDKAGNEITAEYIVTQQLEIVAKYIPVECTAIFAVFNQGNDIITETNNLDTLKQYLTVNAIYNNEEVIAVAETDYVLSGTLITGTSTITVAYEGKVDTFDVIVSKEQPLLEFVSGMTLGTDRVSGGINVVGRTYAKARATTIAPIENKNYILTVTDSLKYSVNVVDVTNLTTIDVTYDWIDKIAYLRGNKTIAWNITDSTSTPYIWIALKKNDGTDFTEEELANNAEAVITITEGTDDESTLPKLNASTIVSLPDIYNNGKGWTSTGLAYDKNTNTFLVGDIGKALPTTPGFASQIVRVSCDFSTVIEQIPLYATFPDMKDIQGITIDTTDDTIWFCSTSEKLIRHIDKEGNSLGSFAVSDVPSGISYSPLDNTFWILTTGKVNNIKHINKTGSVLEQYTFDFNETLDQCFLDYQKGYLYITAGANYLERNIVYMFNISTHEQRKMFDVDSYAVEGIWVGDKKMIILNDGYYHNSKIPINQANFYTLDA